MGNILDDFLSKTISYLETCEGCLGGWHFGSVSRGLADDYSDLDPVFLVTDESFDKIDSDYREIIHNFGTEIVLNWPEEFNSHKLKNYAILLETKDKVVQFDFTILNVKYIDDGFCKIWYKGCTKSDILFDTNGEIERLLDQPQEKSPTSFDILWNIQKYWVMSFIGVKYYKRNDIFKLLYINNEMFHIHSQLLLSQYMNEDWGGWADKIKRELPKDKQKSLLKYFCSPQVDALKEAILSNVEEFERDAITICNNHSLQYPKTMVERLKRYMHNHMNDI